MGGRGRVKLKQMYRQNIRDVPTKNHETKQTFGFIRCATNENSKMVEGQVQGVAPGIPRHKGLKSAMGGGAKL